MMMEFKINLKIIDVVFYVKIYDLIQIITHKRKEQKKKMVNVLCGKFTNI